MVMRRAKKTQKFVFRSALRPNQISFSHTMKRREFLKYSAATAVAGSLASRRAFAEPPPIKVGVVGAKTGPLAPGAAVTHFPPYRMWAHEINNERGGIKTKEGPRKVELIEYDDRTQPPEAIKAVERLAV